MSVFDFDQRGLQTVDAEARLNPLDISQVKPDFFDDTPKAIGMGLMRGGVQASRATNILLGAPVAIADTLAGKGGAWSDSYFRGFDDQANDAVDFWTPNAHEVGTAGRVLGGLAEIAPQLMATGGNPSLMLATQTATPAADLVRQGVDAETAETIGLIQGAATAVGFRLPFLGKNLASRMMTGVTGNLATNAGATALQQDVLDVGGYDELARQYDPLNAEARALDVLTGMAFGGLAHLQMRPSDRAAVAAANNAKHFQADTAPGVPADLGAQQAHQAAIEQAIRSAINGEPIVAPPEVSTAEFTPAERKAIEVPKELQELDAQLEANSREALQLESPRAKNLDASQREIEDRFRQQVGADPAAAEAAYSKLDDTAGGKILNTDSARELSADYLKDRGQSAAVHEPASTLVKWMYARRLADAPKEGEKPLVLFTAGGTGAGKTSALAQLFPKAVSEAQIVYDTNMNKADSAIQKIDQALAAGKRVKIVYVFRDPLEALTGGALPRAARQEAKYGSGRTVPLDEHIGTHTGARQAIEQIAAHYAGDDRVQLQVIDNSRGKDAAANAALRDIPKFDERAYNELRGKAIEALDAEHQAGRISDAVRTGFAPNAAADEPGSLGRLQSSDGRGNPAEPAQARKPDRVVEAARQAAISADIQVPTGEIDADGNPVTMSAAELLSRSDMEIQQAQRDATGFEAAVNCFLSTGGQ